MPFSLRIRRARVRITRRAFTNAGRTRGGWDWRVVVVASGCAGDGRRETREGCTLARFGYIAASGMVDMRDEERCGVTERPCGRGTERGRAGAEQG